MMGDDVEISLLSRSPAAIVEIDPGHLDQVVVNLAVNARDAMPNGGKLIVETAAVEFDEAFARQHPPMKAGSYVMLAISDNGLRHGPGHGVAHLRAFLHHEGNGQRHRAGAGDGVRHRAAERRPDLCL